MVNAYYNDGNKEDGVKFYCMTPEDVENANTDVYTSYIYNVTKLQTFIKGLFKYTLYEDGWNVVDDTKMVTIESADAPCLACSNENLFHFFMQQLEYSLQAEGKVRSDYQWEDERKKNIVLSSLHDIVVPDFNNWRKQMLEHK